jgi:DNA-binding transcriptional MocR family regulator
MWRPLIANEAGPVYRQIADAIDADRRADRLAPGARLPTIRDLAQALSVTVGTVNRAYRLAERRGTIVMHVGRGSFLTDDSKSPIARPAVAAGDTEVDLSFNRPPYVELAGALRRVLADIQREADAHILLDYGPAQGRAHHREVFARWAGRRGVAANAERIIVTTGAQQALAVAIGTLTRPGDEVMVESLTYPGLKNFARLFGFKLVPVEIDEEGLDPDAFEAACAASGSRLLFCMPHAHNPTTRTLAAERSRRIAEVAARRRVLIIEGDVYARGADSTFEPFGALLPDQTIHITSLSKTVAPGLRVGFMIAPAALVADLVATSQTISWTAPPLVVEFACRWIDDGTADEIADRRRLATHRLHALARDLLDGLRLELDADNPHLWLPLAPPWTGRDFAAAAAAHGVIVTPSEDFAVGPDIGPAAVRLCLGAAESDAALARGLAVVAELARGAPRPTEFQV